MSFLQRFSTENLPAGQRIEAYRDILAQRYLGLDVIDHSDGHPHFDASIQRFGAVSIGTFTATPIEHIRTKALADDIRPALTLNVVAKGGVRSTSSHRDVTAKAGASYFTNGHHPSRFLATAGGIFHTITVPVDALHDLVADPWRQHGQVGDSVALNLLVDYCAVLRALREPPPLAVMQSIEAHVLDLIAAVIGPTPEGRDVIAERGLKAARRQAVLSAMDRHFNQPQFTVSALAIRLGVSRRYVHHLLEHTGRTFSQHVLDRRLRYVHALLSDANVPPQRIIDIAGMAGFGDVSYFNRQFRARFGKTPTSVRCTTRHNAPLSGTT
ncbi:AraC family transcriptional regulator [Reyranella sp. CPCC 100927]|uniref:helix-turn-helix domain-containing protein n=1 Tax=Reyranella sp. CPCC 100927 TaxID=2599616 RepID=UPI0015B595C0|nr:AraC family transcriptional regulator [Reyranella sp. CPCC 100927]